MKIYFLTFFVLNIFCNEENFVSRALSSEQAFVANEEDAFVYNALYSADKIFLSQDVLPKSRCLESKDNVNQETCEANDSKRKRKLTREETTSEVRKDDDSKDYNCEKRQKKYIGARLKLLNKQAQSNFSANFNLTDLSESEKSTIEKEWDCFVCNISSALSMSQEYFSYSFRKNRVSKKS